jgi:hypothetical protein
MACHMNVPIRGRPHDTMPLKTCSRADDPAIVAMPFLRVLMLTAEAYKLQAHHCRQLFSRHVHCQS